MCLANTLARVSGRSYVHAQGHFIHYVNQELNYNIIIGQE